MPSKSKTRSRYQRLKPSPSLPRQVAIPERERQNGGMFVAGVSVADPLNELHATIVRVDRAVCECWLDRYHVKGHIGEAAYKAGLVFRTAWLSAAYGMSVVTKDLSAQRIDCFDPMSLEERLDRHKWADRRVKQGLQALSALQKLAVIAVCGNDEALGSAARIRTLRRGLEAMAKRWRTTLEDDFKIQLD